MHKWSSAVKDFFKEKSKNTKPQKTDLELAKEEFIRKKWESEKNVKDIKIVDIESKTKDLEEHQDNIKNNVEATLNKKNKWISYNSNLKSEAWGNHSKVYYETLFISYKNSEIYEYVKNWYEYEKLPESFKNEIRKKDYNVLMFEERNIQQVMMFESFPKNLDDLKTIDS